MNGPYQTFTTSSACCSAAGYCRHLCKTQHFGGQHIGRADYAKIRCACTNACVVPFANVANGTYCDGAGLR